MREELSRPHRLLSINVPRSITIRFMILVNSNGIASCVPSDEPFSVEGFTPTLAAGARGRSRASVRAFLRTRKRRG